MVTGPEAVRSRMAEPTHRHLCLMKHLVGEDSGSRSALRRGQGQVDEESSGRMNVSGGMFWERLGTV